MVAILFLKLRQIYIRLAFLFCANLMQLAIFQEFEHLNDFQTIGYGSHFVFHYEAKIFKTFAGQDFPWAVFTF